MFLAVRNLTEQALAPVVPWEFQFPAPISAQVRGNKKDRQDWYRTASTVHQFYTAVEPANPNQRASKSNPPKLMRAIVADYDLPVDDARIDAGIAQMPYQPQYVERSLGGNFRLVWLLSRPFLVERQDFAIYLLQQVPKWLKLEILPGLDSGALTDPTRLYCNGGTWREVAGLTLPENAAQAFFVKCGSDFNFKPVGNAVELPLDLAEEALKKAFPNFTWPGEFSVGSQGPSFWIPESVSPMSAIVKPDGMFTFSANAAKPFYSWADILGNDFVKNFQTNAVAEATQDIFFDGKLYWKRNTVEERFISAAKETLITHLKVNCRVSTKPDKTGTSLMDRCLAFIHEYNHVEGGAPVLFQPPGLLRFGGVKLVNTAPKTLITAPSGVLATWGPAGSFPFISSVLDNLFDPARQKEPFLAWLKHFYCSGWAQSPRPGQNIFLAGGPGCGKTLTNREIVGGLLGGHTDAARFMLGDVAFNASLFQSAVWSVDDETISDNDVAHRKFSSYIKLCAANQSFEYRKKFEHNLMIPWMGRVVVTLNLDDASSRTLPALDGSILDKISFFRCVLEPKIVFPDRYVIQKTLKAELPHLAQWLIDWAIPAELKGDSRYGVKPHHEPALLDKAHQSTKTAPFKELLVEYLTRWFAEHPNAQEWRGSLTQLVRGLHSDPTTELIMRGLRLETANRHIEALSKEGVITCKSENGARKTRIWMFARFVDGDKNQ